MSRESRVAALRARRALGLAAIPPDPGAPVGAHDPSLGARPPVTQEAPPPTPVPAAHRGVVRRCGRCESFMAHATCDYCARMTA